MRIKTGTSIHRFVFLFVFFQIISPLLRAEHLEKSNIEINFSMANLPLFADTSNSDTTSLIYPLPQDKSVLYLGASPQSSLYLSNPLNIQNQFVFDPIRGQYVFTSKMGDLNYRPSQILDLDEYRAFEANQALHDYWKQKASERTDAGQQGGIPKIHVGGAAFERIFGSNTIDIRPQGSAELLFGVVNNKREDPALNVRQQSTTNFDFQQKIQLNVSAKIGDKIEFKVNYNTEATFDFENKLKLKYEGKEDEIIQLIEAGDVNLPLTSTLIQGSQSLFGVKSKLRFGKTTITSVFSEQKSESSSITVQGGGQKNDFRMKIDEYEENRHFFLSKYFRNNYERALSELPIINSNINITKIEVWVTNVGAPLTENRNILALQDLGENQPYNPLFSTLTSLPYPFNEVNNLKQVIDTSRVRSISNITSYLQSGNLNLVSGIDYEKVELARKLRTSEYTLNRKLGFISLNTRINPDQILAVSYQYTVIGDQKIYQVGEFSDQGVVAPNTLLVKLIKSTATNTQIDLWKLMMKNVYNIGAYQVNREDFALNILYTGGDDGVPKGYLAEGPDAVKGINLLEVMKFDRLDRQLNPSADGVFDFIDQAAVNGGTIQASNGRVFFPMLEPFGQYLRTQLANNALADFYCYDSLYTLTKSGAQQYPAKNKFILDGSFKSSTGSEIALNALNVPQGSVKVTAGGIPLVENVDYTIDYTLGRVRIINEGILSSGTPINISMESTAAFSLQTKRMVGTHIDYDWSKNLHLGGTFLNLSEKPITQKTNIGDDPINNTIYGFDVSYQQESRWITKMVDKLPFIETDAPSTVTFNGEFAHFLPGHSRTIGTDGTSYIDDFEGTKSTIDLKMVSRWAMASTPQGQTQAGMFPEAGIGSGLMYGMNRAKLAWYIIDPLFYDQGNLRPPNINAQELSKDYVRQVLEKEVFPAKETPNGYPSNIPIFNLAFYPNERGSYNYDVDAVPGLTSGIDAFGNLKKPETRWGGIMRQIETSDFEATNIEYIEFWMMDPFSNDPNSQGGQLYFNLGDVSEDILRDSRKAYENGLPISEVIEDVDTTIWGRIPVLQSLVDAFDNQPESRPYQDVGFDGLSDDDERNFFQNVYLNKINSQYGLSSQAFTQANTDPSADNFHYFRGTDFDDNDQYSSILERYKKYNGPEGNSPASEFSNEAYPTLATTLPDVEDINRDNTLSEAERYYQYAIDLHPDNMEIGKSFITDIREGNGSTEKENGDPIYTKWYQFKVPVRSPSKVVGAINDFKSIRFIRMFMKGFEEPKVLRFATLELVRSDWRRYRYDLLSPGEYIPNDIQSETVFDVAAVNIEENGSRYPIPYVIPPGIEREINIGTTNLQRRNEQAMQIVSCDLLDGDARATFKTVDFDFRRYKKLKMFVHAEKMRSDDKLDDGDLTIFLRLGADFTENYYEYEIPLQLTDWGTSDPEAIWPESNRFDIDLERLVDVKLNRNIAERESVSILNTGSLYSEIDGVNKITVKGSPSLSDVKAIMIGVRNPKKTSVNSLDDGLPKCAEIWINELRVSDFDNKSAWAATARAKIDLADLGNVIISGAKSTAGFGGLESGITQRQLDDITNLDVATNLEIGKFFPEKWGIRIPMHFDYSESKLDPEFNPLDPDINFTKDLESYPTKSQSDSARSVAQDFTLRKNINFINVRKDRTGSNMSKIRAYDLENFDLSFSYSEVFHRNIDIEYHLKKAYRGGLGYNVNFNPKPIEPFKRVKFLSGKNWRIIRDFNFYLKPRLFTFRTDINREYEDKKLRNKSIGDIPIRWTWSKRFDWNRSYNLRFDLTRSIKLDYNAKASAFINEPEGRIDRSDDQYMIEYRDFVLNSVYSGGKMNQFDQTTGLNYTLPINKIPLFNWVNATARYQSEYHWIASPLSLQDRFGNSIENSSSIQLNGTFRISNLYAKIPYLKKLGRPSRASNRRPKPNQRDQQAQSSQKEKLSVKFLNESLKVLMMWKDASITYSENKGNYLPGFIPEPDLLGNNWSKMAPGLGYVFGLENDIRYQAGINGWLSTDSAQNQMSLNKESTDLNIRATLEPIKDFRIEVSATRTSTNSSEDYYKWSDDDFSFQSFAAMERGSFSMSFLTIGTAFKKINKDNSSEPYDNMRAYRLPIAERLAQENLNWTGLYNDSTGFPVGYGSTSQDVIHGAFLAAYTGKTPRNIKLGYFPAIPLPNWRFTYKGLSNIPLLKKWFKNITISHAYRSSYNIGSYVSNIQYQESNGFASALNDNYDFNTKYDIALLSITEQFSPLIRLNATLNNSMLVNVEIKRSRNLALSFVNNQLTEVISQEYIVGIGYRLKGLKLKFSNLGSNSKQQVNSDLNLKADFSLRDNRTILRRIDQNIDQVSSGQKVMSINFSADYMMSQRMTLRFYYDQVINNPYMANQYRNSTTNGGISMRFTLAQ
ncbi:MAG: cell surface protein SprA [Bacteroidales bacterium]|nr:cell surface protein SprA [Bacteroidales bacterium]